MYMEKTVSIIALVLASIWAMTSCNSAGSKTYKADVVVYGGNSAAVSAAVQVSRMGRSVIMVSPDTHLGGLSSSGLGFTDTGNKEVIGGIAREFYGLIYDHYQKPEAWKWQKKEEYGGRGQGSPAVDGAKRTQWIFEPHVAEEAFEHLIAGENIEVFRDEWLDRESGVVKKNGTIKSIRCLSGKVFKARVYIDATYEGDLMAAAGVDYFVGREANDVYGEQHNGVQTGRHDHRHYFLYDVDPYVIPGNPESGLLFGVAEGQPGEIGSGDNKIQAYNFRLCLTKVDSNRVPFFPPEDYSPANYELLARYYAAGWDETFSKFDPIPNGKTDTNNHGAFNSDFIGMNYRYPEAGYEERAEIIARHRSYQMGLYYFIATDPRVPEATREEMAKWGYARDEFADNDNWPYNIYVREARRMIGQKVMTENEVTGLKPVEESIGMGSYTLDSHNIQRFVTDEGYVQNEGDVGIGLSPYQIEMKSILPKSDQCNNLVVPTALSCSHIAFGSIRMEPVFLILGQSAAVMAVNSIDLNKNVADVNYSDIVPLLEQAGQVLKFDK